GPAPLPAPKHPQRGRPERAAVPRAPASATMRPMRPLNIRPLVATRALLALAVAGALAAGCAGGPRPTFTFPVAAQASAAPATQSPSTPSPTAGATPSAPASPSQTPAPTAP